MQPDARYPIGRFHYGGTYTAAERSEQIQKIATLPDRLEMVLEKLDLDDWETPYRPEGWTIRQVVHHLPDSHLHAYTRVMFALAEEGTTIAAYDEERWVAAIEKTRLPPEHSLGLLRALHARWTALLSGLKDEDFLRTIHHPAHARPISVDELIGMYAWHGDHHLAHIQSVLRR